MIEVEARGSCPRKVDPRTGRSGTNRWAVTGSHDARRGGIKRGWRSARQYMVKRKERYVDIQSC